MIMSIFMLLRNKRYVAQYNQTATPKSMQIGQQVIVLLPDSTNKFVSRWQGPGTVVNVRVTGVTVVGYTLIS